jgi:hypothetical protein
MKIWIAVLLATSVGCTDWHARDVGDAARQASMLVYFKDPRTGLCFAGRNFSNTGAVVTNVPCSPAVDSAIAEQAQTAEPQGSPPSNAPPGS